MLPLDLSGSSGDGKRRADPECRAGKRKFTGKGIGNDGCCVALRRVALLGAVALLIGFGTTAQAAPFGLQIGDEIVQIEWDALQSNPGDGGDWDVSEDRFHADGRVTAVNLTGASPSAPALNPVDSDLVFDLSLDAHGIFVNFGTGQAFANALLPGFFVVLPSFEIFDNCVSVLEGQFAGGGVFIEGNFALNGATAILTGSGAINITDGDTNLVNALGGIGAGAEIILSFSAFNFIPPLLNLAADGNIWSSDFTVSLSGSVSPFSASPFVPEPSTALMFGGGLLGLLGVSRRMRTRR
jgi:hypothetical protein